MGKSRPINRSPFRRKPWARTRRPASWHECLSTGASLALTPGYPWADLNPPTVSTSITAEHTFRELLGGQSDALYLDRETVRIDRIVGDIQFYTSRETGGTLSRPPVVRLGLILEADGDVSTAPDSANLWDSTSLGESKWQYLEELSPTPVVYTLESLRVAEYYWSTHLDVRTKRSLGKRDRLWLVMTYGNGMEGSSSPPTLGNEWNAPVRYSYLLRGVLVA